MSDNLTIQSVAISDTDTESDEVHRIHLSLDDTDGDGGLDLARQYKQECDALKSELEEMRKSHAMELARMEAQHRAVIKELKKENDKFIRWRSKKRAGGLEPSKSNTNVLMLNLDEVADHVKKRFSKSGAEEVCSMLYHLAVEHGTLAEETLRQIDSIVPAILKRNTPHQIFELPNVSQFNNNPGTVVNS